MIAATEYGIKKCQHDAALEGFEQVSSYHTALSGLLRR